MKKNLFYPLFALVLFLGVSSCSKDPIAIPYNLSDFSPICIPASPNTYGTTTYEFPVSQNDIKSVITTAGVSDAWGRLQSAKLTAIQLQVTSGASTFDEIAGVQLYAKNAGTSGDGEQVAYTPDISAGSATIDFLLNGTEIAELVKSGDLVFTVKLTTKAPGNQNAICMKLSKGVIEIKEKK